QHERGNNFVGCLVWPFGAKCASFVAACVHADPFLVGFLEPEHPLGTAAAREPLTFIAALETRTSKPTHCARVPGEKLYRTFCHQFCTCEQTNRKLPKNNCTVCVCACVQK
uniref:Uncharacterized protein n=1 Tax=Anopheles quadriannulatus TaxID=34691 RepID=A0A182XQN0_ANOQN